MSEKTEMPPVAPVANSPATLAQLKTAFPKAGADFIVAQLESGATLEKAQGAWNEVLQARIDAQDAELNKVKKPAGVKVLVEGRKPAARTVENETASSFDGDARAEMSRLVGEKMKLGFSRMNAVKAVARANPELHRAYLEATNPSKVHHLIAERFE